MTEYGIHNIANGYVEKVIKFRMSVVAPLSNYVS